MLSKSTRDLGKVRMFISERSRDLAVIAGFVIFLGLAIAVMKHASDEMETACPNRRLTGTLTVVNSTPAVYDATDVVVFYTQGGATAHAKITGTVPAGDYSAAASGDGGGTGGMAPILIQLEPAMF